MQINQLHLSVYRIPTDRPEQDGTYDWTSTTLVLVEPETETGLRGLGYSYADGATATLIKETLAPSSADGMCRMSAAHGARWCGQSAILGDPVSPRWRLPPWTWRSGI